MATDGNLNIRRDFRRTMNETVETDLMSYITVNRKDNYRNRFKWKEQNVMKLVGGHH